MHFLDFVCTCIGQKVLQRFREIIVFYTACVVSAIMHDLIQKSHEHFLLIAYSNPYSVTCVCVKNTPLYVHCRNRLEF